MIKSLTQFLSSDTIKIVTKTESWQSAVELSAVPLLQKEVIKPEYLSAIFKAHEKLGPYYVLGPRIAMPHARPEEGANDMGLSLLVIKEGVNFGSAHNDPVHLVVMLAAKDSNSHIGMLQKLAELFSEDDDIDVIINAQDVETVLKVISKY